MTTNEIIKALKNLISVHCPAVFFGKSKTIYPKVDADLRFTIADGVRDTYILTLDYFDDTGSYTKLNDLADKVSRDLSFVQGETAGYLAVLRNGNRFQPEIKDNDKIVHVTERFQILHYREE
jgi:hypothetical protein